MRNLRIKMRIRALGALVAAPLALRISSVAELSDFARSSPGFWLRTTLGLPGRRAHWAHAPPQGGNGIRSNTTTDAKRQMTKATSITTR
jgi:hypothetical protein